MLNLNQKLTEVLSLYPRVLNDVNHIQMMLAQKVNYNNLCLNNPCYSYPNYNIPNRNPESSLNVVFSISIKGNNDIIQVPYLTDITYPVMKHLIDRANGELVIDYNLISSIVNTRLRHLSDYITIDLSKFTDTVIKIKPMVTNDTHGFYLPSSIPLYTSKYKVGIFHVGNMAPITDTDIVDASIKLINNLLKDIDIYEYMEIIKYFK